MSISRELSQFANFLDITDSSKNIGIAVTATPYVGFGTTNATTKVEVVGGLTADYFYGDGSNITGIATELTATIGISSGGNIIGTGISLVDYRMTNGTLTVSVPPDTASGVATVTISPQVSLGLVIALGG